MGTALQTSEQQLKKTLRKQLKETIAPQTKRLHLALLLAVLGTLVFIGRSWLLADV